MADCGVEDLGKTWQVRLVTLDATVISSEKPDPLLIKCLVSPMMLEDMPPDIAHNRLVKLCRRIRRGGDTPVIRKLLQYLVREIHRDQQSLEDPDFDEEDLEDLDDESYDKLYNELIDESREKLIYEIVD